jgi:hypothetical protein
VIIAVGLCIQIFAQTNSIEFQDTVADQKTGAIGYKGTAENGYIFIETPNASDVRVQDGNIITQGTVTAEKYYRGNVELDSVKAAGLADSAKKIPDGSVTNVKLSPTLKVHDENIDSVSWDKIRDMPAGFADGEDNTGTGGTTSISGIEGLADSLTNHRTLIAGKANEEHAHTWDQVGGLTDSLTSHRNAINGKAAANHLHTVENISGVADSLSVHRALINSKADKIDVYTKSEIDTKIVSEANGGDGAEFVAPSGTALTISGTMSALQMSVEIPEAGFLVVNSTATLKAGNNEYCAVQACISTTNTEMDNLVNEIHWLPNSDAVASNIACSKFLSVTAGTKTLYFLFKHAMGAPLLFNAQMNCVFVKQRL